MIPQNGTNTLQCHQLFHQYVVDMYAKIESERLFFILLNHKSLRLEECINLRDAIANDGNITDIGKKVKKKPCQSEKIFHFVKNFFFNLLFF